MIKGVINPIPYIKPAAVGTKVWKKLDTFEPWKTLERLPHADMINIKHVYIQKGPYKSGFSVDIS
jgi:hypothetical protein